MAALGEAGIAPFIRSIGLWQGKARNVAALSRLLMERHGGEVPRDRAALEALPGVGRKTANVVLNVAFGESAMAVDTHIFRLGNRTGLAPGRTPREVEDGLVARCPPALLRRRPSLADPARALRVQGADAGVLALRRAALLQLREQGAGAVGGGSGGEQEASGTGGFRIAREGGAASRTGTVPLPAESAGATGICGGSRFFRSSGAETSPALDTDHAAERAAATEHWKRRRATTRPRPSG